MPYLALKTGVLHRDLARRRRTHRLRTGLVRTATLWAGVALVAAGCGVHLQLGALTAASRDYVVCTSLGGGCGPGGNAPVARPKMMVLSGDGSLYVKGITWRGWATPRAVGNGTAYADNCKPNCVTGTYFRHPAIIVVTVPRPWHGKLAYSHAQESVPGVGWHRTVSSGLVPAAVPPSPPPAAAPPAPGPVSTQATVTSSCVLGFIPTGQGAVFVLGAPQGQTIDGTYYPPVAGYQLTIGDASSATADVDGFAVVFYDSQGDELGSDKENVSETFITSGQSLNWTEYSAVNTDGNDSGIGSANIPPGAATCQMVSVYHP